MNIFHTLILSIVEGITEFLPISSTGHMVLASTALKIPNSEFLKTFEISIQLGAILAVVSIYSKQLIQNISLSKKLVVAFIPTGIVGYLFYKIIKYYLFSPLVVSTALVIGGLALIWADHLRKKDKESQVDFVDITYKKALIVGLSQSLAVIPGVSRAAATILGGMYVGLSKKQATEFSFLLAIPTMIAATGYDLLKSSSTIELSELVTIIIGAGISFVTAWFTVKLFIKYIDRQTLTFFGLYRVILGISFLFFL